MKIGLLLLFQHLYKNSEKVRFAKAVSLICA